MNQQTSALLESARALPDTERAELLDGLFDSFETSHDASTDHARAVEAENRIDAHDNGIIKSIPELEAYSRLGINP